MKVLHAPTNIAGQASILSRSERALGHVSDVLVFDQYVYNYPCDYNLRLNTRPKVVWPFIVLAYLLFSILKYDVFHFHYRKSFLPGNLDLPILKLLRKKVIMHYWGSDIIQTDIAVNYTRLTQKDLQDIYPNQDNEKIRARLRWIEKHTDVTIVGDYSLLPFSPNSIVVRQAVDLEGISFVGSGTREGAVRIVHAPTNRKVKGTHLILPVVEQLISEGYPIEFILVENKPHTEALAIYKEADIVIDDVLQGPYGIFAIECMSLGKPVLDRIDEKLVGFYKDLPIQNTPPEAIYERLKTLIENPLMREELGRQGREYVERNHNPLEIARQLVIVYGTEDLRLLGKAAQRCSSVDVKQ